MGGCGLDLSGLESCPVAGFSVSGVEPSVFVTRNFINWFII
jgi:hypothetical protein